MPAASSNLPESRPGKPVAFCLVLLRMGFTCAPPVTRRAVVSYSAFPPLPGPKALSEKRFVSEAFRGGLFLLHWPWSRLHRTLSGILPCEARTFLTPAMLGRDHLFYLSPQLLLIIMCFPQNVKAILYIEAGTADEFADNRILADTVARHRKEIIQELEQALCLQIFRTILVNGKQQRLGIHL